MNNVEGNSQFRCHHYQIYSNRYDLDLTQLKTKINLQNEKYLFSVHPRWITMTETLIHLIYYVENQNYKQTNTEFPVVHAVICY